MAIKTYKPVTPGRRGMTVTDYSVLSKVEPERSLLESLKKNSGRNSYGRITVRHKGGAQRRKYRVIDFIPVRAVSSFVPQVTWHSSWLMKTATLC